MLDLAAIRRDWFSNIRADVLAGLVVALALIPEAIGFSIIAGVDPRVGLYASVAIAMVIAFTGGRPGMISAATAAVAVVVVPLVRDHGVEYLFAATILMGVFQGVAALLRTDGATSVAAPKKPAWYHWRMRRTANGPWIVPLSST